jgi:hypothetical protein
VRIEAISIDFIKDEKEAIYFLDVGGFRVTEYEKISKLALLSEDEVYMKK